MVSFPSNSRSNSCLGSDNTRILNNLSSDLIVYSSKGYRIGMPFLRANQVAIAMANWYYGDAKFVQHGNKDRFNGVDRALSAYKCHPASAIPLVESQKSREGCTSPAHRRAE